MRPAMASQQSQLRPAHIQLTRRLPNEPPNVMAKERKSAQPHTQCRL